jgi:excisionase family DNA binding protein
MKGEMMTANSNDRLMRVLQATPEQLAMIDRALEGRSEERAARSGPLLMQVRDAAKLLGVHRATIWRLVKAGRLTPVPLLGGVRIRREEIEGIVLGKGRHEQPE